MGTVFPEKDATMSDQPDLRRLSVERFVVGTKLHGSGAAIYGFTVPEGWPFAVIAVVVKPGSEEIIAAVNEFQARMAELVPSVRQDWAPWPK